MIEHQLIAALWTGSLFLVHLAFVARSILRPHREPASRIAWVVVIMVAPVIGIAAYLLLGEINIGRRRANRVRKVHDELKALRAWSTQSHTDLQTIPDRYRSLFRVGHSVNGFQPVDGNRAQLLSDSNSTIDSIVADMDAA